MKIMGSNGKMREATPEEMTSIGEVLSSPVFTDSVRRGMEEFAAGKGRIFDPSKELISGDETESA